MKTVVSIAWFGVILLGWTFVCAGEAAPSEAAPPAPSETAPPAPSEAAPPAPESAPKGGFAAPPPVAETTVADPGKVDETYRPKWSVFLWADESYQFRASPKDELYDQDLKLALSLGATDPSDHWSMALSAGLLWDLNGVQSSPRKDSSIQSLYDYSEPVYFDVFKLYGEYHSNQIVKLARAGRMVSEYGPSSVFDGATLVLRPIPRYLDLFVYGGRTEHYFHVDSNYFEDWMAAGGVVVRPIRDLKFEAEYRFAYEDTTLKKNLADHAFSLTGWYRYPDWVQIKAFMRTLNRDVSNAGGGFRLEWLAQELGFDAGAKAQLVTLHEISEADDPYLLVLGESRPHVRFHANAYKLFTSDVGVYGLHLGFQGRRLTSGDETPFNRNVGRVYLLFTAKDILIKGPFLSAVFERWGDGPRATDNGLWTFGGSLGYDVRWFRAEIGSFYQLYKYTYYEDASEKTRVRTFFGEVRGHPLKWLAIHGRYEFERFDRDVHTFLFGITQIY